MKVPSHGTAPLCLTGPSRPNGSGWVIPLSLESASNLLDPHTGRKRRVPLRVPDNQVVQTILGYLGVQRSWSEQNPLPVNYPRPHPRVTAALKETTTGSYFTVPGSVIHTLRCVIPRGPHTMDGSSRSSSSLSHGETRAQGGQAAGPKPHRWTPGGRARV